jgi:hypothetical protein
MDPPAPDGLRARATSRSRPRPFENALRVVPDEMSSLQIASGAIRLNKPMVRRPPNLLSRRVFTQVRRETGKE